MSALKAGGAYFASVFAVGFALGTIRVLMLEPRVGATAATLLELPFMLAASWLLCRFWANRFRVASAAAPRLTMGAVAFGLLIAAESLLGLYGFDRSLGELLAAYATPQGALGLLGQTLFGLFPLFQLGARRR